MADQSQADGTRILFVSRTESAEDLWIMDPDGNRRVNLTRTQEASEFHPSWSSDGTRIAFIRVIDGEFQLCAINVDGTGDRLVVHLAGHQAFYPHWSPDDEWIAFTRDVSQGTAEGLPALFLIRSDGTGERKLTQ